MQASCQVYKDESCMTLPSRNLSSMVGLGAAKSESRGETFVKRDPCSVLWGRGGGGQVGEMGPGQVSQKRGYFG